MGGETVKTYNVIAKENTPPIAEFTCYPDGAQRINCFSQAQEIDANDQISSLSWEVYHNNQLVFSQEGLLNYSFDKLFPFDGEILVKMKVADLYGGVSEKNKNYKLIKNQAPVARASCNQQQDQTYLCSSSSYDLDGSITLQEFFVDGEFVGTSSSFVYNFKNGGSHLVKLIATDNLGAKNSYEINVEIDKPIAGLNCSQQDYTITCSATITNVTQNIYSIKTYYDDEFTSNEFDSNYSYLNSGPKKITLKIFSGYDVISETSVNINIPAKYLPPSPQFIVDYDIGRNVEFDASASLIQERQMSKYRWNFGDGIIIEGQSPKIKHNFSETGWYSVNLEVTDSLGTRANISNNVYIGNLEVSDPGTLGRQDLLGIDENNNGLRVDVERWIIISGADNIEQTKYFKNMAITFEEDFRNLENAEIIQSNFIKRNKIKQCLTSMANYSTSTDLQIAMLEAAYANTDIRFSTKQKISEQSVGQAIELNINSSDLTQYCGELQ